MNTLKRYKILFVLLALLVPVVARGLTFYHGLPVRPEVKSPDYANNAIPEPPINEPILEEVNLTTNKTVVIDYYHGNGFNASEIETLVSALKERGAKVEFDTGSPSLSERLKYASAYLVFSPNYVFSNDEMAAIRRFVAAGGRMLVLTDPTRGLESIDWYTGGILSVPDTIAANMLLTSYDLAIANDYLYNQVQNEGNFRNVYFNKFGEHELTAGINSVVFYGTHSVSTKNGIPLLIGNALTQTSLNDSRGLSAGVLSPDGNVLALGDFSFMIPPFDQVADNRLLVNRLADFALSGQIAPTLINFPYLFHQEVNAFPTGNLSLIVELLNPLSRLQSSLRSMGIEMNVSSEPVEEGDKLVVGVLQSSEDLAPYLAPFELNLDDPDVINLPGFGDVQRPGIGVLLFNADENGSTLLVLTDNVEDLPSLIDTLAGFYLSGCVIQGNIGVCPVGYGEGFSTDYGGFDFNELFPELTLTPTPEPVVP